MSIKAKIEAILFLTSKPIKAQAIAALLNEDSSVVRQTILSLIQEYENKDGALEIASENGYIIQVKEEYANLLNDLNPIELSQAAIRTLSAIAIKQPVIQSEIIKLRGSGAYDHIKELLEKDFISKHDDGRSPTIMTTKKFQEYFRLSKEAHSLRKLFKQTDNDNATKNINPENIDPENSTTTELETDKFASAKILLELANLDNNNSLENYLASMDNNETISTMRQNSPEIATIQKDVSHEPSSNNSHETSLKSNSSNL